MGLEAIKSVRGWALDRARKKLAERGILGTMRWGLGQVVEVPSRYLRRRRGLRREREYDRLHGIDTAGIVNTPALVLDSGMSIDGYAYQGCDPDVMLAAIRRLSILHHNFVFIDLGSGKGRSLHCAREFGFRRYVGVEFAPSLCEVARRNNARLKQKDRSYPDWEIVCADAGAYEFSGPTVLCLYNPFGPDIMRQVVQRAKGRSDLYVLYFNPTLAVMWEKGGFRTLHREADYQIFCAA